MFAVRMIQLIEIHGEKLSGELLHRLQRSENYRDLIRRVPPEAVKMQTDEIHRNLGQWLWQKTQAEIEERNVRGYVGQRRVFPYAHCLCLRHRRSASLL
jgi:hypothetical protein